MADHHLQVKEEDCHLFYERVKYCGHILRASGKVAAVWVWTEAMIQIPRFGVCNWYFMYIPQYVSLAAPLTDSLKEKYRAPPLSSSPLPPGTTVPPHSPITPDTTPDQPLTSTYYVEFMAVQLLVVGRSRIWD